MLVGSLSGVLGGRKERILSVAVGTQGFYFLRETTAQPSGFYFLSW